MTNSRKEDEEALRLDETPPKPKKSLAIVTQSTWTDLETKNKKTLKDILEAGAEDYSDIELSETEEKDLVKTLKKMATGAAAFAPMRCAGSACPFASECPLQRAGKAPIDKPCLLEETMLKESILSYVADYDIDPNNFTELGICTELAEIEVLQWRLNMALRRPENAGLVMDQSVGVDRDGQEITQLQVSPIFEQKQKLANRKSKLIKLMVGDRQEKYKMEAALKQKVDDDASSSMASVKQQLKDLQMQAHKASKQNIIDAEVVTAESLIDQAIDERDNKPTDET